MLEEYDEYLPLSCRQIFYRLVAAYGYHKTEADASKLNAILSNCRRAHMIPFAAIRDDTAVIDRPGHMRDKEQFLGIVRDAAAQFTLDKLAHQPYVIEVWSEAAGMVPPALTGCP